MVVKICFYIGLLFSFGIFFSACQKEEPVKKSAARTIIVYMVADNDLSVDALNNLEEMKHAFSEKGTNLVVFIDQRDKNPTLLEIHPDKDIVVKSYQEVNSANPAVLREIISEVIDLYPAKEYGLILWSHSTSWLPAETTFRSFGLDNNIQMNIKDLEESLPIKFNFILFDACLMGAVEVEYELKDKADFIIAPSTETINQGFPYSKIIPELLQPQIDFNAVAQSFYNFYNSQGGVFQSATVSVVETRYLPELANQLKLLCENNSANLQSFDRTSVQRLDMYNEQYTFDLLDFVNKIFPAANKSDFVNQLNKAVLYKYNTQQFMMYYDINTYCGLSCYIPIPNKDELNTYYKTLKWYYDAGLNFLF